MSEAERAEAVKEIQLELFQLSAQIIQLSKMKRALRKRLARVSSKGMKRCRRCGEEMPVDQFYTDRQKSDLKDSYCWLCRQIINNESRERRLVSSESSSRAA